MLPVSLVFHTMISKIDLVRNFQSLVNQKSMFHLKLSPPLLEFQIKHISRHFQRIDQFYWENYKDYQKCLRVLRKSLIHQQTENNVKACQWLLSAHPLHGFLKFLYRFFHIRRKRENPAKKAIRIRKGETKIQRKRGGERKSKEDVARMRKTKRRERVSMEFQAFAKERNKKK